MFIFIQNLRKKVNNKIKKRSKFLVYFFKFKYNALNSNKI
jgi:hypothetical protein